MQGEGKARSGTGGSPRRRVLGWIEETIGRGELRPGQAVPSVRALAAILGVAPHTAATALVEAERAGIVVRRAPGARRRFVPDSPGSSPLVSSTVCVLCELGHFADEAAPPRWSVAYLSMEVVRHLSRAGRHVILLNGDTLAESDVDALFRDPPAGMAVTSAVNDRPLAMHALERCREAHVPAVVYGDAPALRGFDRVYTDHRAGERDVTAWLAARGCRRIAPLFPFDPALYHWARERLEGYAEAMRAAGLKPLPCAVFGTGKAIANRKDADDFRVLTALAIAKIVELRRGDGIDALVCLSDDWAKPVLAAIRELGLEPNRDILVAGYDNASQRAEFDAFEPARPAVTLDKHNERTAADLASLLLARMAGKLPPEPQARTNAQELVVTV